MNKKILFTLFILFILPNSIKAVCTNQELNRYKTLASHINTYYEYDEANNKFNVTLYNVKNELYILNSNTNEQYSNTKEQLNDIYIYGVNPGTQLTLGIYPINGECNNYRTRTIYVNIPNYNQYYTDPVCTNNSNQLCSKWANTSMYTYEQFVEKVKIKEEQLEIEEKEPEKVEDKYGFFDFLADYYIIILLLIIILGSYGIYKLDKKSKFDF